MRFLSGRWTAWVAALLCGSGFAPFADAATYVPIPDAELVDRAERVVAGRVVAKAPARWGSLPATELTIEGQATLKGRESTSPDKLLLLGGRSPEGLALRVPGLPRFAVGESVLLFLAPPLADGRQRLVDPLLGAFREVRTGSGRWLVRSLEGALSVGSERADPPRERERFFHWIEARVAGREIAADYQAADRVLPEYSFLDPGDECADDRRLRWFVFDESGGVAWRATAGGQPGLAGGGFAEWGAALAAWSDDPTSNIAYADGGTVAVSDGCDDVARLADPNDEIPGRFTGRGVIAMGGSCFSCDLEPFRGVGHHRITGSFVVTQDGIEDFFTPRPDRSPLAAEIFAHELGHTLGLGHSDDLDALMWRTPHQEPIGASLRGDDVAAIQVLYGPGAQPPAAPSDLAAVAVSSSEIDLTWDDTSFGEMAFRLERLDGDAFRGLFDTPPNSDYLRVADLEPATPYVFRLRAVGEGGESDPSNAATATTLAGPAVCPAPPASPQDAAAEARGPNRARISWSDVSTDEQSFDIERWTQYGWVVAATALADVEEIELGALQPRRTHRFRVRSRNAAGASAPSAEVDAVLPDDPGPGVPSGEWMVSAEAPGYRFKARFGGPAGRLGRSSTDCLPRTVCVSNAGLGRSELQIRILPDRPNGFDWVLVSRLSLSWTEVWVERIVDAKRRYYSLPIASAGFVELPGVLDTEAFP